MNLDGAAECSSVQEQNINALAAEGYRLTRRSQIMLQPRGGSLACGPALNHAAVTVRHCFFSQQRAPSLTVEEE
jgi:hypothetical protein